MNTKRNLLDVDDAVKSSIRIINQVGIRNETINILNKKFYSPLELVKIFEKILGKKANYYMTYFKKKSWVFRKSYYLKFDKNYLKKIIKKYYT